LIGLGSLAGLIGECAKRLDVEMEPGWAEVEKLIAAGGLLAIGGFLAHAFGDGGINAGTGGNEKAASVENGNAGDVVAVNDAINGALKGNAAVSDDAGFGGFLKAVGDSFTTASEIAAERAALGVDLIDGVDQRHHHDAGDEWRHQFYAGAGEAVAAVRGHADRGTLLAVRVPGRK